MIAGRRPAQGSLDLALAALALITAVVGLVLIATSVDLGWWDLWSAVITGWSYAAVGLIAWWRRPHNRMGPLLLACGWSFFGLQLAASTSPDVAAGMRIIATLPLALIIHVLLAFPSGRLTTRLERALVGVGYLLGTVLEAPVYLCRDGSPLQVLSADGLATVVHDAQSIIGTVVMVSAAVLLLDRARRADAAQRIVVGPLCVVGAATLVVLALLGLVLTFHLHPESFDPLRNFAQPTLLLILPITFLLGLSRGGFARAGEVRELAARIADSPVTPEALRDAIAEALGDRSVTLVYWLPREARYADADGQRVELPSGRSGRRVVEVASDGERVGAIVYDALLISDVELVRTVAQIVGLALDRQRLNAELRSAAVDLRASRQRLAVASDAERRRIARDLHDGAQQRLVLLAIDAQRMARVADDADRVREDATRLREEVEAVLDDLRGLVHRLEPALLTERGLPDATAWLVARMPVPTELTVERLDGRLPSILESTGYFVVSEALANVVKHAHATRCAVELRAIDEQLEIVVSDDGTGGADATAPGLRGLSDRLGAVGGTFAVVSPQDEGTRLQARMPLADAPARRSAAARP